PFHASMMLPTLLDTFNAGCWYFAGIVLTLRRARWFGTRLLPAALALFSTAMVFTLTSTAMDAALLIVIVQALGALAAWNAFSTAGAADCAGAPSVGL